MKDLFGMESGDPGPALELPKRTPLVLNNPVPRGKHYVEPRGYIALPGTGPEGKTCSDCAHYVRKCSRGRRSFPKCGLNHARWTSGRGSDILARAPACSRFNEADDGVIAGTNRTTSGAIGQP